MNSKSLRSDAFFILTETEKLNKLSCHSYNPKTLKLITKLKEKGIKLSNLCEKITYSAGKWELKTTDYVPKEYPESVKLLQISNIGENGEIINTTRDKFITKTLHEKWKSSQVIKGDLIIAITGTIERIALFNEEYQANLNQALGIIRLKNRFNSTNILPEYIHLYLNSKYAIEQLMRLGGFRSGQAGLSLDEINEIYIILPKESEQKKVIQKTNKLRKEVIEHYKKYLFYAKSSKIFPLTYLKIKMPKENKKTFIFNENLSKLNRIDAINNSPFLRELQKTLKKEDHILFSDSLEKSENKFEFNDYYNLVELDNIDENIGIIKSHSEVKTLNSAKTVFKEGNISISKLGAEKGNIILIDSQHNNYLGSGELMPFKLKENSSLSKEYLFYLLRSPYLSKQIEYTLSGCSRMRITKTDVDNLIFPKVDKNKEKIIVSMCQSFIKHAIQQKEKYKLKKQETIHLFEHLLKPFI